MAERIRTLVADDHPLFREGVVQSLDSEEDFEIVAEASTGEEAFELAYEEGFKRGVELYKTARYIRPTQRRIVKYLYRPDGPFTKRDDKELNGYFQEYDKKLNGYFQECRH